MAGGAGVDMVLHGQPVRCWLGRPWHCEVSMVPVRAAAASSGPAPAGPHCGGAGGVHIHTGVTAACERLLRSFPLSDQFIASD